MSLRLSIRVLSQESHIGVAKRLNKELANSHILDQYSNPSNPLAHYDATAEEILHQTGERLDAVVIGAGTGGTITGIARKLKERLPHVRIVGVDPVGSILAQPDSLNGPIASYAVEGIGYDFIPTVLDRALVDLWIKTEDRESLLMARRLIREEGLLCGGSSGAAMVGALRAARQLGLGTGARIVVILPDSVRNYMSKFLNDDWMRQRGFLPEEAPGSGAESQQPPREAWTAHTVADMRLPPVITALPSLSCSDAVEILRAHAISQLPVVEPTTNEILGTVTEGNILSQMLSKRVSGSDPVSKVLYKQFKQVSLTTTLAELNRIFDTDHFAIVVASQKCYSSASAVTTRNIVCGIVTRIDLLNYILAQQQQQQ